MQTSGKEWGGHSLPLPAARVPFLEHPSVVLSGPGPGGMGGQGSSQELQEGEREGGRRGGARAGGRCSRGPGQLWALGTPAPPPLLPCRGSSGLELQAARVRRASPPRSCPRARGRPSPLPRRALRAPLEPPPPRAPAVSSLQPIEPQEPGRGRERKGEERKARGRERREGKREREEEAAREERVRSA